MGSKEEERTKWSIVCCAHRASILGFTDGIPNGKLNIISMISSIK
jgi:hypothetical protein